MDREAAPAAADVEHPLARLEAELPAGQLQLRRLRRLQRLAVPGEEGATVRHRLVEEQREELVGDVVVVTDGASIPDLGVPRTFRPELRGRR
jgi:hypothetical protein